MTDFRRGTQPTRKYSGEVVFPWMLMGSHLARTNNAATKGPFITLA
nr:hypothetical protein [uncultured bacterium]